MIIEHRGGRLRIWITTKISDLFQIKVSIIQPLQFHLMTMRLYMLDTVNLPLFAWLAYYKTTIPVLLWTVVIVIY